jgi:hypothetical protein
MWAKKLWQRCLGGSARLRPQSPRWRSARLGLEQLEDRTVPSSFAAASVSELIADINAANKLGGSNTIALSAPVTSPYLLTGAYGTNRDGATALPTIALNDNLTIIGNGDTIERSTASGTPAFRLFDVASGGSLTLQSLTLQGGLALGSGVSAEGGAIYNQGALVLNGVTVQNNIAQGVSLMGKGPKSNAAPPGANAAGGGIYSGSGTVTLSSATFQGNQALGGNGVSSNTLYGGYGGDGSGGGLYVAAGTVDLINTTLTDNRAAGGSGGNSLYSGGNGGSGHGGGLCVAGGTVKLTSTTLSNNVAAGGPGGSPNGYFGAGYGGGIYVGGGTVSLFNDTVQFNHAESYNLGEGGGIANVYGTVYLDAFTLANLINNTASTSGPNIQGSYNLLP